MSWYTVHINTGKISYFKSEFEIKVKITVFASLWLMFEFICDCVFDVYYSCFLVSEFWFNFMMFLFAVRYFFTVVGGWMRTAIELEMQGWKTGNYFHFLFPPESNKSLHPNVADSPETDIRCLAEQMLANFGRWHCWPEAGQEPSSVFSCTYCLVFKHPFKNATCACAEYILATK